MSHLDTFDPKPGTDVQGPVESIKTNANGIVISEYLPRLASHMDKFALIRSMHSTQGAHAQGQYFMHTSYIARGTIQHPSLGAWVMKLAGRSNLRLPGSVVIGGSGRTSGPGFMASKFAPVVIGNPGAGLQNSRLPKEVTKPEFDRGFRRRYDHKKVRGYSDMYDDAIALMESKDLKAFDIKK